jgi:hypothetical protein
VALGTDEAVGFWYHLGYTPNLLFQWVYDADLYETETDAMLSGPLAGLHFWRSSFDDVPQLFVNSTSLASTCVTRSARRLRGATSGS